MADGNDDNREPEGNSGREVAAELADQQTEFISLMQHFYRGELGRMADWRARIDRTTNWAVGLMAALITWAFSAVDHPHYIILGSLAAVTIFLTIETRRYRIYDIWRSRVRLVEENVLANAVDPTGVVHERWRELLAEDLREPTLKVPFLEALARRLRRVYLPLMTIIVASWGFRITVFSPEDVGMWEAAAIGPIPGTVVVATVSGFYFTMLAVALWPTDRLAMGKKREPKEPVSWRARDK